MKGIQAYASRAVKQTHLCILYSNSNLNIDFKKVCLSSEKGLEAKSQKQETIINVLLSNTHHPVLCENL